MTICKAIRIPKNKLCAGDLRNLVKIMKRSQGISSFDDSEATETFAEHALIYMAIKTVQGGSWVNNIQTLPETTHLFFCRYSTLVNDIDITTCFLLHNGIYYRILKAEKINEDNLSCVFQSTVRGDKTLKATHA